MQTVESLYPDQQQGNVEGSTLAQGKALQLLNRVRSTQFSPIFSEVKLHTKDSNVHSLKSKNRKMYCERGKRICLVPRKFLELWRQMESSSIGGPQRANPRRAEVDQRGLVLPLHRLLMFVWSEISLGSLFPGYSGETVGVLSTSRQDACPIYQPSANIVWKDLT